MNRRSLLSRCMSSKSAARKSNRLEYFRTMLEPLEDRKLLSAVTWTIDQAASSITLTIPDQNVILSGTTIGVAIRNQIGGNSGPWNVGNSAHIGGTILSDYVDDSTITFSAGQP